jgi:hypothetical protein
VVVVVPPVKPPEVNPEPPLVESEEPPEPVVVPPEVVAPLPPVDPVVPAPVEPVVDPLVALPVAPPVPVDVPLSGSTVRPPHETTRSPSSQKGIFKGIGRRCMALPPRGFSARSKMRAREFPASARGKYRECMERGRGER